MTEQSKPARYEAQLKALLPTLPSDKARFDFITAQMSHWEELRDAFIRKVDRGGDPGTARIEDYTETIQVLEIEQAKYSPLPRVDASGLQASVERLQKTVEAV